MAPEGTLLLRRGDVEERLGIPACIEAIENIFRLQGEGRVPAPGILAVKTAQGGPARMASAKVVADSLEQSCTIGDTHHAIAQGLMRREDVYAELSEIVAGRKPGRTGDDEIIVFDSTGVAIEDAVAAVAVYEAARDDQSARSFDFAA